MTEQWIFYMTTEFGFINIADRYATSSSMMPPFDLAQGWQKRRFA